MIREIQVEPILFDNFLNLKPQFTIQFYSNLQDLMSQTTNTCNNDKD